MTGSPDTTIDTGRLAALLIAAREGRRDAFDELVVACRPFVQRQARQRAWRSDDVDDIVQEVWLRLFEHAAAIREPRALLAWLMMVTARVAASVGRRRVDPAPAGLDRSQTTEQPAEDVAMRAFERREVTEGVRVALARLDAEDRRILLLLEGPDSRSYREASRELQRPIGSLGPTRQRLLRRLRHDPAVRRLRPAVTGSAEPISPRRRPLQVPGPVPQRFIAIAASG